MKSRIKHISVSILFFISFMSKGQDLIITNELDSINVKILKVDDNQIDFKIVLNNKLIKTFLSTDTINSYEYDYYHPYKSDSSINYPKFRTTIDLGYSFRLAKVRYDEPNVLKEYFRGLKSGFSIGTSNTYFLNETSGLGVKMSFANYKNKIDESYYDVDVGGILVGWIIQAKEDIRITYIAPYYSKRILRQSKNAWIFNIGLGYLGYNNNANRASSDIKYNGQTIGLNLDIANDIMLSENFAIGFQLSLILGRLTKYQQDDFQGPRIIELDKEDYENLNRLDFTVGIRFY